MKIHMIDYLDSNLGPGNRLIIWTQGCKKRCPNCIAKSAQNFNGGFNVEISKIINNYIRNKNIDGITISGGEPFDQSFELFSLIKEIKKINDYGIIIYSGYKYSTLLKMSEHNNSIKNILSLSDLLIDGEYISSLDDGKSLRGSSNQNAIFLSDRYKKYVFDNFAMQGRKTVIKFTQDGLHIMGIPNEATKKYIRNIEEIS